MTGSREDELVELVDEGGTAIGAESVRVAHEPPGRLHRAFSVLLVDAQGRVLLQRRAAAKTRFPLRWANSCCGHPAPGQPLTEAANRRVWEELGVGPVPLTSCGVYLYRADDPATGRIEYEYDHVLRGSLPPGTTLLPDPTEVADIRWDPPVEVLADLAADPARYAPWLGGVLRQLVESNGAPDPTGVLTGEVSERPGAR